MSNWRSASLSEVCQIKPPKKEAKAKLDDTDLVSFVPMNDLGICNKKIDLNENRQLGKVSGSYTYFADDDVLLAKITPCFENGKLGIARDLTNSIGFGSSEFIVFRSKGELVPEYLFYFLSQDSFRIAGAKVMTGAVGHKRVPKDFIENHKIPLPPLAEQKSIVAILDAVFSGITKAVANAEKNLANARELFESYLNSVFTQKGEGWVDKSLEEECNILMGQSPVGSSYNTDGEGVPLINGPVEFGGIDPFSKTVATKFTTKPTKMCKTGDLILCVRGSTTGRMNIAGQDACIGRGVAAIRSENNQEWINQFISFSREKIYALGSGSTFPNVSADTLKKILIPFPPKKQRRIIVGKIEDLASETHHLENIYQKKLITLAELKQSILQKAFAGELTTNATQQLVN